MLAVASASLESLQPGQEIGNLEAIEDFDGTVLALGGILVDGFLRQNPNNSADDIGSTLYPPHSHASRVVDRFKIYPDYETASVKAFLLRPTHPSDIFTVEGFHLNLLSVIETRGVDIGVETMVYLTREPRAEDLIRARKSIRGRTEAIGDLDRFVQQRSSERRMKATGRHANRIDMFDVR